ncbi:MAG: VanW family protein [Candidatus Limnocylindrales bacterium]|jgi:vancomycin resistance protein YoaR
MTTDELDLVDEIVGLTPGEAPGETAGQPVWRETDGFESTSPAGSSVSVAPRRRLRLRNPLSRAGSGSRRSLAARLALAFAVGLIGSFVLATAAALIVITAFSNRVVPGVRVGSVDVSGLNRDQVVARLQTDYAYLGQGEVTVTTPVGAATITYQQAGRAADVEFMADEAMRIGHTGNPIDDAAYILRAAINGQSVPIAVRVDPKAVATRVRELADTYRLTARDGWVMVHSGTFAVWQSTPGSAIDEKAVSSAIVDGLAQPDAPATFQVGGAFVTLNPRVSGNDARDAIAAAERMAVDLDLTWGGDPQPVSPRPSQGQATSLAPIPSRTYTIDADTIRDWIVFGTRTDGSYGPSVDPARVQSYVSELAPKLTIEPVEPTVITDSSGKPASLKGGRNGASVDVAATSQVIEAYLDRLASGGSSGSTLAIVSAPISPRLTPESLSGMVVIGGWTTVFFPGVSNGWGANIRVPAKLLNGQVVAPGQQFSFLRAVGPINSAHGYTLGGVILQGKSDHTGAMGGGICSASTTMFNAAARAGLQIDERHQHYYYIDRYPVGLDATVFSNGSQVWDLKWTNDTPNPIVIRAWATNGSKSTITVQLWSLPLDRKVTFSPQFKANVVRAVDRKVYVTTLRPGQQNRAEYPTAGFDTSRTRTVTDSTGKVIHRDTWKSRYKKVDGLLQIGRSTATAPPATPPPSTPVPTTALLTPATPPPAPTPTPGLRRRQVR